MAQVLLVRHGQASWGTEDYDRLSPLGEEQSRVLGATLAARGLVPDLVVRGAMRRHRQTADAVTEAAGWDPAVSEDGGWNEFDHVQMLAMHPTGADDDAELTRAEFQAWFEDATRRWVGGGFDTDYDEPFTTFAERVDVALGRVVAELAARGGETAVVLTSGGPITWAAASLLGGGADLWTRLNPVTVNAAVTKVVVGSRGATLVSFNDHSHLEGADGRLLTYR